MSKTNGWTGSPMLRPRLPPEVDPSTERNRLIARGYHQVTASAIVVPGSSWPTRLRLSCPMRPFDDEGAAMLGGPTTGDDHKPETRNLLFLCWRRTVLRDETRVW